jgi:hypothetical protein
MAKNIKVSTTEKFISSFSGSVPVGTVVETLGYSTEGDGGGASWKKTATTGTASQSPAQLVDALLNDASGNQWALVEGTAAALGVDFSDSTDSLAALTAGFGGALKLTDGTVKVTGQATATANTKIDAVGNSKIRFDSTTTASKDDFAVSNSNVSFKDFSVEHNGVANETAQVFQLNASDIRFKGLEVDTNHTAILNNAANAFQLTNSNVDNVRIEGCDIHNVNRIMLRSNATTGTLNNFWFQSNYCHDLGEGGMQFNFPNGTASGVAVVDNYFDNFVDGSEQIFMGGASVKQAIFSRNITKGTAREGVHLEEGAEDVLITNNVFNHAGTGAFLTDNNVGGVYERPERITILGNIFSNSDTIGTHTGISAQEDALGIESSNNLIISDNQLYGYLIGMNLNLGTALVQNNIISDCVTGIRCTSPNPNISGNSISNATTGISVAARGGLIGKNTFNNVTSLVDTDYGEAVSMLGFIVNIDSDINLPATTTTNVNLGIPVGLKFSGSAAVSVFMTPTSYQNSLNDIGWDGATLTSTEVYRVGSGAVGFSANTFVNNAGQLAISINNTTGSDVTLKGLSVDFTGMWTST